MTKEGLQGPALAGWKLEAILPALRESDTLRSLIVSPEVATGEDVLEETPEFLQDAPEHDRLWFEQKPPRDFDFDDDPATVQPSLVFVTAAGNGTAVKLVIDPRKTAGLPSESSKKSRHLAAVRPLKLYTPFNELKLGGPSRSVLVNNAPPLLSRRRSKLNGE